MTCQMKTPLSHDGGNPWEGAVQFLVGDMIASGYIENLHSICVYGPSSNFSRVYVWVHDSQLSNQ